MTLIWTQRSIPPLQVCRALSDCVHEQVAKRIVNVRFTKKEHLLRETSQKSRLHSPAQITQKKQDDVIKL